MGCIYYNIESPMPTLYRIIRPWKSSFHSFLTFHSSIENKGHCFHDVPDLSKYSQNNEENRLSNQPAHQIVNR